MLPVEFFSFDALTKDALYEILALRQRVFIVEQHCFYLDADGHDKHALHAIIKEQHTLVGCARILPPGTTYDTASIGRIALDKNYRGQGLGEALVRACIETCLTMHASDITITAQVESLAFYKKLGFVAFGGVFEEAGIPHQKMRLKNQNIEFTQPQAAKH